MSDHSPLPWRVGDAGRTVFGPNEGKVSPETIADIKLKANAAFIVKAVNYHEALVSALEKVSGMIRVGYENDRRIGLIVEAALKLAKGE